MKKFHYYSNRVSKIYREAGYSDEIVTNIECWEAQYPSVEGLLLDYQYIEPDKELLFSEHSMRIIIALHNIEEMLETQREITRDIEFNLWKFTRLTFKQTDECLDIYRDETF